ncbi:DUF4349 domain-containing protein [Halomonas daqiaonensis]|uniref:DUF4349 domain-containing protein n=1 Tax=Halomonas daqiaonensis TaxID=650850 RepID=A0A1H7JW94_9GAMM|nr:DUF4349 domain-containing protein [Halomonas daqiaonensis]SEK78772.1 protein of unknown function [Halomonas daqiaonensis]
MPAMRCSYRVLLPPLLLAATLGLAGCDGPGLDAPSPRPTASESAISGEAMVRQADVASSTLPANGAGEAPDARIEERRHYQLQFDEADALLAAYRETQEACVASAHCRIEQGRLQTPRQGLASGYLALRVARDRVDTAEPVRLVAESPALSGVEITRHDRTQQFIDTEARLAQQKVLRERLKELAQQGRGFSERRIQDLLQVERELARVQGEIESMQGQQRHLARVTDSVAITANFQEQRWVEPHQHGVLAPLWRALDRSLSLFFESVGQVILVVVFLTPWLVIGLPALWLLSRLWRPVRRAFSRLGDKRRARRKAEDA